METEIDAVLSERAGQRVAGIVILVAQAMNLHISVLISRSKECGTSLVDDELEEIRRLLKKW